MTWSCAGAGKHMAHKRFTTAAAPLDGVIYVAGGYDNARYLAAVRLPSPMDAAPAALAPVSNCSGHVETNWIAVLALLPR